MQYQAVFYVTPPKSSDLLGKYPIAIDNPDDPEVHQTIKDVLLGILRFQDSLPNYEITLEGGVAGQDEPDFTKVYYIGREDYEGKKLGYDRAVTELVREAMECIKEIEARADIESNRKED